MSRYQIDSKTFESFDDMRAAYLHLWIHGRITSPAEDLFRKSAIISCRISEIIDRLDEAIALAEDAVSISEHGHRHEKAEDLMKDIKKVCEESVMAADEARSEANKAEDEFYHFTQVSERYIEAFDDLITAHYPEIVKAVEKAKLMQSLEK